MVFKPLPLRICRLKVSTFDLSYRFEKQWTTKSKLHIGLKRKVVWCGLMLGNINVVVCNKNLDHPISDCFRIQQATTTLHRCLSQFYSMHGELLRLHNEKEWVDQRLRKSAGHKLDRNTQRGLCILFSVVFILLPPAITSVLIGSYLTSTLN